MLKNYILTIFLSILLVGSTVLPVYSHDDASTQRGVLQVKVANIELVDVSSLRPYNEFTNIPYGSNVGSITPEMRESLCLSTATSPSDSGPMYWDSNAQRCYQKSSTIDDGLDGQTEILLRFRTNHQTHINPTEVDGLHRNYVGLEFQHIECTNASSAPYASTAYCNNWEVRENFPLDRVVYEHTDCLDMEDAIVAVHGVSVGDDDLRNAVGAGLTILSGVGLFVPGVGQIATLGALFALAVDQRDVDFGEAGVTFTKDDLGQKTILTNGANQKIRVTLDATYSEVEGQSCGSDDSAMMLDGSENYHAAIPDWFKSNAKWWNEGLISDAEIIAALETLIETDVIPLERFIKNNPGLEHTAGVPKGGTFIPVYIKDVFGFWSDGIVSDNEIANSVGFLIGQGIIDSEKIREKRTSFAESAGLELEQEPIEYRTGSEDTFLTKQPGLKKFANISMKMPRPDAKEIIFDFYEISKWNKLGALLLEKSSELESEYVKTQLDDAWNDYSDTNDMQIQQKAIALENDYKKINSKLNDLDSLIGDINNFEGIIISESGKLGIPILELESAGKEPQSKIESDVKRGSSDFEKVHSQAEEAIRTGDKKTRILDDLLWDGYSSGRYVTPTLDKQTSDDSSFSSYYQLSDHLPVKADFIQERLHELQTPEVVPEPESEPTEETEPEPTAEPVEENQENSVSSSEASSQTEYQITVVEMDGKQFPITQFTIWKWDGECDSMWHYHTASSHATSLQSTIKNDPDPDNCGFGLVDYIPKTTITITEDQMNQFKEMTGINPVGSEPIYGGEGP